MDKMWYLCEYNNHQEVLGDNCYPKKLKIYDTTLRDGGQTIGTSFSLEDMVEIAKALDDLGVDYIEAGMPVVSEEDKEAVKTIAGLGLNAEVWGFARASKIDIDLCLETGVNAAVVEIPTSKLKWKAYGMREEDVLRRALESVKYAKSNGLHIAFFAVDATRTELSFLEKIYKTCVLEGGADEVVLVDTLGVANPEAMSFLTKKLKDWVSVPVMVHCHNDFGLGVASTFASIKAGADCAHVTVNGLGEKTGNCDIAEVAMVAEMYGIETNIDLKKLYDVSLKVEKLSGVKMSPLKPVVGDYVFKRESGVTVAQLASYPPAVEGYSAELLGREREVLLSKKSGKGSIQYFLDKHSIKAEEQEIMEILKRVKELGSRNKGNVSEDEFKGIARDVLNK